MEPLSGRQFEIAAGAHAATVVEVGAGLRRYAVGGVDVTCAYGEDELSPKCSGAVLMPWPNRIRAGAYSFDGADYQLAVTDPSTGNAIHGLGRWARWAAVEHVADHVTLRLDVVPQSGYPFQVQAEVSYRLDAAAGLTVTMRARNTGARRAPFGAGSHPYLSTRGQSFAETTVALPAARALDFDAAQIPVGDHAVAGTDRDFRTPRVLGELRLDDGFTDLSFDGGRGVAEVRTSAGGAQLWFDQAFGYLQAFTRENLTPGVNGVAIEPMTCAPDAFNSGAGLIVLEPGQDWSASWGITPL